MNTVVSIDVQITYDDGEYGVIEFATYEDAMNFVAETDGIIDWGVVNNTVINNSDEYIPF